MISDLRWVCLAGVLAGCSMVPDGDWLVDQDDDGVVFDEDCDDGNGAVYPGAPEVDGDGRSNDCDPIEVSWVEAVFEEEPVNEQPMEPETLPLGWGVLIYGGLSSYGWDPTLTPSHEVTCGADESTSDFPPLEMGDYTGDVDWMSVQTTDDGRLCAMFELDLQEVPGDDLAYDVLLYDLDPCQNPLTLYRDDTGAPFGLSLYSETGSWSAAVEADASLGVVLAGFTSGETFEEPIPWRLGLALVQSEQTCPELPDP